MMLAMGGNEQPEVCMEAAARRMRHNRVLSGGLKRPVQQLGQPPMPVLHSMRAGAPVWERQLRSCRLGRCDGSGAHIALNTGLHPQPQQCCATPGSFNSCCIEHVGRQGAVSCKPQVVPNSRLPTSVRNGKTCAVGLNIRHAAKGCMHNPILRFQLV